MGDGCSRQRPSLDGAVSQRYQLRALPTTFFIDCKSIIRSVVPDWPISESLIQSKIADLLAEALTNRWWAAS